MDQQSIGVLLTTIADQNKVVLSGPHRVFGNTNAIGAIFHAPRMVRDDLWTPKASFVIADGEPVEAIERKAIAAINALNEGILTGWDCGGKIAGKPAEVADVG